MVYINYSERRFNDCFGDLPIETQRRLRTTIIAMKGCINEN